MKTYLTKYLVIFALLTVIFTIVFRFFLSYGIDIENASIILGSAAFYAISMLFIGWYFGKRDGEYTEVIDTGFKVHFTTYIIHNLISELWFLSGLNSSRESITVVHYTAIFWGLGLLLHFLYYMWMRRKSVDGLDDDDLFE